MPEARDHLGDRLLVSQAADLSIWRIGNYARYDCLRLVLAAVLLAGAALKGYQLASSPVLEDGLFKSRWFLISVVEFELAFGLWLIGGQCPHVTRRAAIAVFALFGAVSMAHAFRGDASCGCFGTVSVNPWLTTALDIAALAGLFASKPDDRARRAGLRHFALLAAASLSLLAATAAWMATRSWSVLADAGIAGDSGLVVLEPHTWLGKRFPLFPYIHIEAALREGHWIVLLYHNDCPQCQQVIHRLVNLAHREPPDSTPDAIALIEIPPISRRTREVDRSATNIMHGQLDGSHDWFVTAPVEVHLADGVVRAVFGAAELANDTQLPRGGALAVGTDGR